MVFRWGSRLALLGTSCGSPLKQRYPKRSVATTTSKQAESALGQFANKIPLSKDMEALALSKIFGDPRTYNRSDTEDFISTFGANKPPHHLHVYTHKHNTHLTLMSPDHTKCLISKSAGNIGFRKAARGTYDAAYQLSAYVLNQIYESGMLQNIDKLEVVLRGFSTGREAVTKALLGAEGRLIRGKITQVSDSTRIKFGGTRSRKPRRLG